MFLAQKNKKLTMWGDKRVNYLHVGNHSKICVYIWVSMLGKNYIHNKWLTGKAWKESMDQANQSKIAGHHCNQKDGYHLCVNLSCTCIYNF